MDEETRFWEIVFCFAREAAGGGCRCLIRGTAEIPYCRWLIELISEFFLLSLNVWQILVVRSICQCVELPFPL